MTTPAPTPSTPTFFQSSRKAFVAAGVAAVATGGTALTGILADGKIEVTECVLGAVAVVVAAAGAFGATFAATNAS
jgi:hypothetical protein